MPGAGTRMSRPLVVALLTIARAGAPEMPTGIMRAAGKVQTSFCRESPRGKASGLDIVLGGKVWN